jgi:hypothetical protein
MMGTMAQVNERSYGISPEHLNLAREIVVKYGWNAT